MNGRQLSILERETRDMAVRYVEISADKTMLRMFSESISGGMIEIEWEDIAPQPTTMSVVGPFCSASINQTA